MNPVYSYSAFGLKIASEIECPEMQVTSGNPDVTIRIGSVPDNLSVSSFKGVCFEVLPGQLLLKALNVAKYLVSEGREIIVEPIDGADENAIRLFLLGSAMGAILHQRFILPVHGSAAIINDSGVIFAGISGSGKSTLLAYLISKGFKAITDDIAAVTFQGDIPFILPGLLHIKLWEDSLQKLKIQKENLQKVRYELDKYQFPILHDHSVQKTILKSIYILNVKNEKGISIKPISGIEKFTFLRNNTFRVNFIKGLKREKSHFELCNKLASNVEVKLLSRENKNFALEQLAETLITDMVNSDND